MSTSAHLPACECPSTVFLVQVFSPCTSILAVSTQYPPCAPVCRPPVWPHLILSVYCSSTSSVASSEPQLCFYPFHLPSPTHPQLSLCPPLPVPGAGSARLIVCGSEGSRGTGGPVSSRLTCLSLVHSGRIPSIGTVTGSRL